MSDATLVQTEEPWVPADSFATRLIHLRHHLGLTQAQAAKACGLDDGSWSNWERGSRPRAKDEVVEAIARATGCSRDWLMWGLTNMYKRAFDTVEWSDSDPAQLSLHLDADPFVPCVVS